MIETDGGRVARVIRQSLKRQQRLPDTYKRRAAWPSGRRMSSISQLVEVFSSSSAGHFVSRHQNEALRPGHCPRPSCFFLPFTSFHFALARKDQVKIAYSEIQCIAH